MTVTWQTLSVKTRDSLLSDYQRKRERIGQQKFCVFRVARTLLCKDREGAIQSILDTLQKVEEVQDKGVCLSAVSANFDDSLKLGILMGAYITVLDEIIAEYERGYFSHDWHNSSLASIIVEYLGGEEAIEVSRIVATSNYLKFVGEIYQDFVKYYPS